MITGTLEHLRKPLVANVKAGDQVLVVTDTAHDPRVWQGVMLIVKEIGAEATIVLFEPRPADYYDPPPLVAKAMLNADVNVLLASTAMLHSPASAAAMGKGIPSLALDGGMTWEWFQSGAATADYREIHELKYKVGKFVFGDDAREIRVTSRFGTDLTYRVDGRIFYPPLPDAEFDPYAAYKLSDEGRDGDPGLWYVFPGGEFTVAPIEASANGTCVIDLSMHYLGRINTPIQLRVQDGRVVDITGGAEARMLDDYLRTYGDENAWCFPSEASVGLNREARVRGCQREDKVIFGSMHFGLGTNADVGGSLRSNIHMDGVILEPTLYVDGAVRIRDGRFTVPLDGPQDDHRSEGANHE